MEFLRLVILLVGDLFLDPFLLSIEFLGHSQDPLCKTAGSSGEKSHPGFVPSRPTESSKRARCALLVKLASASPGDRDGGGCKWRW